MIVEQRERELKESREALRALCVKCGLPEEVNQDTLRKLGGISRDQLAVIWSESSAESSSESYSASSDVKLPVEEALLRTLPFGGPRNHSSLSALIRPLRELSAAIAAVRPEAIKAELKWRSKRDQAQRRRLEGELSPLGRVREALRGRINGAEHEADESSVTAIDTPLFRGCILGGIEDAERVFGWISKGAWEIQRRSNWMRHTVEHDDVNRIVDDHDQGAELVSRFALLKRMDTHLYLSGSLVGACEAELFFVSEETPVSLVLDQLVIALRTGHPLMLTVVTEDEAQSAPWRAELRSGIQDLIGDERSAKLKILCAHWSEDAARLLDRELSMLSLERKELVLRREEPFLDSMVLLAPKHCWNHEFQIRAEYPFQERFIDGFWVSQTPVTQSLYALVMDENPSYFDGDLRPVEMVSWEDGVYFCNRLSELAGLQQAYRAEDGELELIAGANGFRMLSSLEWGYAASGGEKHTYAGSDDLNEVGWYDRRNREWETHPVAQLKPNQYGLYDMSGNVHEWCEDLLPKFDDDDDGDNDDLEAEAKKRLQRGGSWFNVKHDCSLEFGGCYQPINKRTGSYGLRIARSI